MRALHRCLPRLWLGRSALARMLLPIAWLYGGLVTLRHWAYRHGWCAQQHPGIPVVVVGNVVAGGAGKTPTTIALVEHLQTLQISVGVVSRGHGRQDTHTRAVQLDSIPAEVGDEPLLIHRRTKAPVWVGRSRYEAALALRQAHPEVCVLVCDDGLQHLALNRDLEICVMDARGPGNGWLLPAGPLREPWPRPVDILLYTEGTPPPGAFGAQRQLGRDMVNGKHERRLLASLREQPVDAVAGLARPQAFFDMLRQQGLTLKDTWPLPDHDDFASWPGTRSGRPLLCTEKDAAKLWQRQADAWAVPMTLSPESAFWEAIDQWLRQQGLLAGGTDAPL